MLPLMFFLIFVSSLDSTESRYAIVIKETVSCMIESKINIVLYKNSTGLAKKDLGIGYVENVEAIDRKNNFQVRFETHHRGINNLNKIPSLNVQNTDLCNYISTDILFIPLIRRIYDLSKFCPISKGRHVFYTDTMVSKYRPLIPLGCWIIKTIVTKQQSQPFACLNITIQSLPSLKSEPYKCT